MHNTDALHYEARAARERTLAETAAASIVHRHIEAAETFEKHAARLRAGPNEELNLSKRNIGAGQVKLASSA